MNKYFFISIAFMAFISCQNNPFASKTDSQQNQKETTSNDQNNDGSNSLVASTAVNADLETFGEYLFNTIRKNDYSKFLRYILSKKDVVYLLNKSTDPKKPNEEQLVRDYDEQLQDIEKAFNDLHEENEPDFWQNAMYRRTDYSTTKEYNIEVADLSLAFSHNGDEQKIKITRNPKVNGRWYIMGLPKIEADSHLYDPDKNGEH